MMATDFLARLAAAKARVTIPDAWHRLGIENPPPAGRNCVVRSPFREDRHPSFSIFGEGRQFRDHAHEEHSGDVFDFVLLATGRPKAEAIAIVFEMAGDTAPFGRTAQSTTAPPVALQPKLESSKPREEKPPPSLADAEPLSRQDAERIAASRGLPPSACHFLRWTGQLLPWFDDHGALTEWHLADDPAWPEPDEHGPKFPPAARVIEARRLDRQPFKHIEAKAWTLPGSKKDWPVGISTLGWPGQSWRLVVAVEGGPDLLAAHALIAHLGVRDVLPITLLNRDTRHLHPAAADLLKGRWIHCLPHNDLPKNGRDFRNGRATADAWARDLFHPAGVARVTRTTLETLTRPDGQPVKDLCEALEHGGFDRNAGKLEHLIPLHQ